MIKKIIAIVLCLSVWSSHATVLQVQTVTQKPKTQAKQITKHVSASQRKQATRIKKKRRVVKKQKKKLSKPIATKPVQPKYQIGYNRVQGYHRISATPEHSSFSKPSSFSNFFAFTLKDKLVKYVKNTVHGLNYTTYKLGGRKFDPDKGVYIIDCSIYVDNILQEVFPNGFESLTSATGVTMPTSLHYYSYFKNLDDADQYWDKVESVANLQAGDILVFRNKRYRRSRAGGHVMIVMDQPKKMDRSSFLVRVADSAPYRHSRDTRPARHSGIGIGTLLLRVDKKTGQPSAYAWSIGSKWKSNVRFVMARPVSA